MKRARNSLSFKRLDAGHRRFLKKPFGILSSERKAVGTASESSFSASVGDATTLLLISHGITPSVAVVDFKEKRMPVSTTTKKLIVSSFSKKFFAKNAAGTLSQQAESAVAKAFSHSQKNKQNCLLVIDGEEDLVFLPVVLAAPEGAMLFYGQPGKGVVILESNREAKKKALELINKAFY